jgi:hypothetical protein
MGTRSEIVLWDGGLERPLVLYKHWDGYPEFMIPHIRRALRLAAWMAADHRHWLGYAENAAAYLILYDGLWHIHRKRMWKRAQGWEVPCNVDIRPCGGIADLVEYVYVIRLSPERWDVEVFEVDPGFWSLGRAERDGAYLKYLKGESGGIAHARLIRRVEMRIPETVRRPPFAVTVRPRGRAR